LLKALHASHRGCGSATAGVPPEHIAAPMLPDKCSCVSARRSHAMLAPTLPRLLFPTLAPHLLLLLISPGLLTAGPAAPSLPFCTGILFKHLSHGVSPCLAPRVGTAFCGARQVAVHICYAPAPGCSVIGAVDVP
jgi:hypothetical protein